MAGGGALGVSFGESVSGEQGAPAGDVTGGVKAAAGPRARTPAPSGAGVCSLTCGSRRPAPSAPAPSARTWSRPQSNRTLPKLLTPTRFEAGREIKARISDLPPPPA